ncbi:MAG: 50S ribosomal protein L19 [Candidatus Margulisiibacteriota bacterium]
MANKVIEEFEKAQMKADVPQLAVGDSVVVSVFIIEGKKKRIQKFEGLVTKIQNTRSRTRATVRRMVDGVGVEKSFLIHSPLVEKIQISQRGQVRRAKLYYLRKRVGIKATRVKSA